MRPMGILDVFRRNGDVVAERREPIIHAAQSTAYLSLDDPRLIEMMRLGDMTATGISVNVERAMKNPAMFRAVTLISSAIGMLPLQLIVEDTKKKATKHSLYKVLHRQPNSWQSAFDFKALMQLRALVKGNAYALVLRSYSLRARKETVSQLIPLDPDRVEAKQRDDWSVFYRYTPKSGGYRDYEARDILHLRGISLDGVSGLSVVKQAAEAIALALAADLAAGRMFKNGMLAGTALEHPQKMSDAAYIRLKRSLEEKEGAENAGKNLILEEGMKMSTIASNSRNAQLLEIRKMQVEEIARFTGVPRPLLMVDETSWGSGIYALGQFFVQYALGPWFEAWQQAGERVLLDDADQEKFSIKYNAGALLRGSIAEQGDFFSKALGAGGHKPFMTQNEVRDLLDMPRSDTEGSDELGQGLMGNNSGPPLSEDPKPKPVPPPTETEDDEDEDEE
jgi:HK97 family phage portal protein